MHTSFLLMALTDTWGWSCFFVVVFIASFVLSHIYCRLEKDDSCNGSKTQSATTTESNTPENTVRLDGIDMIHKNSAQQQRHHSYTISETGELIVESNYFDKIVYV